MSLYQIPAMRPGRAFDLTVNAAGGAVLQNDALSGRPAIFSPQTNYIRVFSNVDCRVGFANMNASVPTTYIPAGVPEYFRMTGEASIYVLGATTATGILNVTELT